MASTLTVGEQKDVHDADKSSQKQDKKVEVPETGHQHQQPPQPQFTLVHGPGIKFVKKSSVSKRIKSSVT